MEKKMKVVGFGFGGEKDEGCNDKATSETTAEKDEKSLLKEVLEQLYSPTGTTEQRICKTTADIAYELEMTIPGVSPIAIAKVLHKNGYRTQVFDGTVCWVLYEKEDWSGGETATCEERI